MGMDRTIQAGLYTEIPVRNTFVHFVEKTWAPQPVERFATCPGKPELNKITTTKMRTISEDSSSQASTSSQDPRQEKPPQQQPSNAAEEPKWNSHSRNSKQEASTEQELRLNKTINREITHAASKGNVKAVLDVTWSRLPSMNGVNLATALHRIARHTSEDANQLGEVQMHPGFQPMMKAIEKKARFAVESGQDSNSVEAQSAGFPAQCASIIAWSCATLSVRDDTMLSILADLAGPRLRELKPYEVTNLVWAFAKLAVPCSQLFWNAAQMLQGRRRGEYKAQCLAAAAWSFAKSSAVSRSMQQQLFKSMGDEILPQVGSLKPQEVANTVWSFGHIKLKHQRLFEEVAALLMTPSGVSRFSIAQLTSILTGFAQVKFYNAEAISKIAGVMLRNSNSLTPEQSSSVLWALAELDVRDRSLLVQKLLDMAAADINSFKPQELSVLNIAAKKLCPHHGSFFDACKATQMQGRNILPGTESTGQ